MTIDVLKTISMEPKCVNIVPVRQSVRRSLFGKVDHKESMTFIQKELDAIAETAKKRWNFDFHQEKPVEPSCDYEWTPVKSNDIIPKPYALSRLPYLHEHSENSSKTEPSTRIQVTQTKLKQTLLSSKF